MYPYNNDQDPHHRQPQLFEDTSGYQDYDYNQQANYQYSAPPQQPTPPLQQPAPAAPYNPQYTQPFQPNAFIPQPNNYPGNFPGAQFIKDPLIANAAMQYGQNLLGQGQELIDKKLEKYMSVSKLKYYFAVDTKYVMGKIKLLFFPFTHKDWAVQYEQSEGVQVQPRHDVNAPDLYIPTMAFVTYILMVGLSLGLMNRFSPEVLGIQASSAIVWLVLEVLVVLALLHFNSGTVVKRSLHALHVLALAGYKYPGMILMLGASMVLPGMGYYIAQGYCSLTLSIFMFRTLRSQIQNQPPSETTQYAGGSGFNSESGSKRRFYMLILLTAMQPLFMFFLTNSVAYYTIPL